MALLSMTNTPAVMVLFQGWYSAIIGSSMIKSWQEICSRFSPKGVILLLLAMVVSRGVSAGCAETPTLTLQPFPPPLRAAVDSIFAYAEGRAPGFSPAAAKPLVDFVRSASSSDSAWELPEREGASGSAYIITVKTPLHHYLEINFHPQIPDYAVFPTSLRYSACFDCREMKQAYAAILTGPTGTQACATSHLTGWEEITPNPESGGYFAYTNSRTFIRCTIDGQEALFSCSKTLAPSTLSNRGVLVGPLDQALYYYSERPGLNLTGMTWVLSQITRSTTLSIYLATGSNKTAVANFAWLNAGWKGMNVTRATHILNSQHRSIDFSRRLAQTSELTVPLIAGAVEAVQAMPDPAVNAEYCRYLAYVQHWRDSDRKGLFGRSSLLQELYDNRTNELLPMNYRRALIVQERVRSMIGIPTWSASIGPLAQRSESVE